ncbi:hypothetical protein ACPA9J_02080 [Pseudomonas aeruginosa]
MRSRCPPSLHLLQTGRETIDRVAAGESVKLIFAFDTDNPDAPRAEAALGDGRGTSEPDGAFQRRLDNYPQYIRDLSSGDAHRLRGAAHHQHRARPAGKRRVSALCPALLQRPRRVTV